MTFSLPLHPRAHEADGSGALGLVHLLHLAEHARNAFFAELGRRDVPVVQRPLARAQRVVVLAPVPPDDALRAEVRLARVGGTSFDVACRFHSGRAHLADVAITFVAVDRLGKKVPVPEPLRDLAEPIAIDALSDPADALREVAVRRSYDVMPSDENRGPHMSHAHLARALDDHRRLAARRGAFGDASDALAAPARRIAVLYDREAHFGDALHVELGRVDTRLVDARIVDAGGRAIARARIEPR